MSVEPTYLAVINDDEAYSVWPADRDLPAGWRDAGKRGTRDECLNWIEEVWMDMRPASLRREMDGADA
jgi:MbtH protein